MLNAHQGTDLPGRRRLVAVGYADVHAPRPQALQPRRRHVADAGAACTLGALPAQDQLTCLLVNIGHSQRFWILQSPLSSVHNAL